MAPLGSTLASSKGIWLSNMVVGAHQLHDLLAFVTQSCACWYSIISVGSFERWPGFAILAKETTCMTHAWLLTAHKPEAGYARSNSLAPLAVPYGGRQDARLEPKPYI
jgi:hypothetical protein